ncbi:MAG TPA: hypothetical protein VK828_06140 [Terriglobales bacterium]|jgi:hypothetical protein|nr:hypothetical protein [Terriglobales bacterium]
MRVQKTVIAVALLILSVPSIAAAKEKKGQRGMLENMQAVPCGAKERGLTGLGSLWGSVGVQHVDSNEKLCPQYLLRTDEMDYRIRPLDTKHAVVLPVGHEAEFKIKKDRLYLRIVGGDKKALEYQVVAMQPPENKPESGAYRAPAPISAPAPAPPAVAPPAAERPAAAGSGSNGVGAPAVNTGNTPGVNNSISTSNQGNDHPPQ